MVTSYVMREIPTMPRYTATLRSPISRSPRAKTSSRRRAHGEQSKGSGKLIRLHEKGGQHMMPCHHVLAEALRAIGYQIDEMEREFLRAN